MPRFHIEWGFRGQVVLAAVIEAETLEAAEDMAEAEWDDLVRSNKVATARPFRDTRDNGLPSGDICSGSSVPDIHDVGRDPGDSDAVTP